MSNTNTNDLGRISFKDVAIAYMATGLDGARAQLESPACANPYKTGVKACSFLADLKQDKADLEAWLAQIKPTTDSLKRVALCAGMSKTYNVQQVKDGDGNLSDAFIRLPVGVLNVLRKDQVRVTVSSDGRTIEVTRV